MPQNWLTTRECADRLGVTTAFIVGEIKEGRLPGRLRVHATRTTYRIEADDLTTYVERYWRKAAVA